MYFYNGEWLTNDRDFIEVGYKLDKGFGDVLNEYLPHVTNVCLENDELWTDHWKYEEKIEEYNNLLDSLDDDLDDLDEIIDNEVEKILDRIREKIKNCKNKINEIDKRKD